MRKTNSKKKRHHPPERRTSKDYKNTTLNYSKASKFPSPPLTRKGESTGLLAKSVEEILPSHRDKEDKRSEKKLSVWMKHLRMKYFSTGSSEKLHILFKNLY